MGADCKLCLLVRWVPDVLIKADVGLRNLSGADVTYIEDRAPQPITIRAEHDNSRTVAYTQSKVSIDSQRFSANLSRQFLGT